MDATRTGTLLRSPPVRRTSSSFDNQKNFEVVSRILVALKECGRSKDLQKGKLVHADATQSGHASNIYVANTLVNMYARCGSMVDAARVFAKMEFHNVVSWNSFILGYAENGQGKVALQLFARMNCHANGRTFVAALKACASVAVEESKAADSKTSVKHKSLEIVMAVHASAELGGYQGDIFVSNTLVDTYAKCGSMVDARRVFDRAQNRDLVTWNALVQGYTDCGQEEFALEYIFYMHLEAIRADALSFLAGLKACAGLAEREEGREINGKMVKVKSLEKTMALHTQVSRMGLDSHIIVANTLVDTYAKCGSLTDAGMAFHRIERRDLVLWNTLLMGYAENGEGERVLDLWHQMSNETQSDPRTFVAVLKACGNIVAIPLTRAVHAEICRREVEKNEIVSCCLVDSYARCGSMLDAHQVFDSVPESDAVLWTALLSGYSREGNAQRVFETFHDIVESGMRPNSVTFVSLLTACSHAGLVETGRKFFRAMTTNYGVEPGPEHYLCMVDILGRGNRLDEAVAMVKAMPLEVTVGHWMTILGACKKWKDAKVGRLAFDSVVAIDRKDPAAYSLMLNIYGSAGMWSEMPRIYSMRRKAGVLHRPGVSWWTDESGTVHRFVAGDMSHSQIEAIQAKLEELTAKMQKEGYVPDLGSVAKNASAAQKESSLCGHSERLAIACAIVNSAPGTTIRIAKNLRVCDDCHAVTALFSRIEERKIICRDSSRFHAFDKGSCSCRDFW